MSRPRWRWIISGSHMPKCPKCRERVPIECHIAPDAGEHVHQCTRCGHYARVRKALG